MKSIIKYLSLVLLLSSLGACERVIDLDLPNGPALPYIDAWITDQPGVQTIKLLKATNYMNANGPEAIPDAQITVTDVTINQAYTFSYQNGAYIYDAGSSSIGIIGHAYKLHINYKGEQFEAMDTLKRVTTIDSISTEFKGKDDVEGDEKEGYYAKLYAHDLTGARDYYWIRTYRNDTLNYHVGEMLSCDGAFGEDGITDGYAFIVPFRDGITSGEKPYVKGDNVKVLIRSLSKRSFDFMEQVVEQLENYGLFAKVLTNVPSNVNNLQPGSQTKIYGWFGTVAETRRVKKME